MHYQSFLAMNNATTSHASYITSFSDLSRDSEMCQYICTNQNSDCLKFDIFNKRKFEEYSNLYMQTPKKYSKAIIQTGRRCKVQAG